MKLYRSLPTRSKENVHEFIRNEYEKNKDKIEEYNRIKREEKISTVDEAMEYFDYISSFEGNDVLIEMFNKFKKMPK
jgi:hypothetical protein